MKIFLVLFFLVIIITSLVISFIAIFQILNNDFKESKIKWIIISMIGVIGPILYLIKGRKYIVKNNSLNNFSETQNLFSVKSYYLDLIKSLNKYFKVLFLSSISLIVFGYIVRIFNVSFFWESKQIGYLSLIILIVVFLRIDINKRKDLKIKNTFSNIAFWFLLLVLFLQHLTLIIYPNSDAYKQAISFINTNKKIENELGKVVGYSILPEGSFQKSIDENGSSGIAQFSFIIKGEKKYKEVEFVIEKQYNKTNWEVVNVK